MKFTTLAFLVATVAAVNVEHIPLNKFDLTFPDENAPKTYVWEKQLMKKTQGKPKTQEEKDAAWDGDLGFNLNIGGEKYETKLSYDNNDKFQVQSIIDYYGNHELKEPWRNNRN